MDPRRPRATRIGIWSGRIVGLDDDLDGLAGGVVVDAGGRTVLPGFVDAHNHLVWQGMGLAAVDIAGARSVEEAVDRIAVGARASADGSVDVSGYDQRVLGRHLSARDLDAAAPGQAVYVTHVSGHASVVNSVVLAGLPAGALDAAVPGIDRDDTGAPTGLFLENAQNILRDHRPPWAPDAIASALRRTGELCARQGITFCAEAGVGAGMVRFSPVEPAVYQQLADAGQLPVRVQLMVAGEFLHDLGDFAGIDLGLHTGFGDDRVSLGAVKFWLDGGMSARTAALTEPYADLGGRGDLAPELDEYRAVAVAAHAGGWQLALHAIGDRAVDAALDIIEEAQRRHPGPGRRPRIEHCGLVRPDQLPRMAACGAVAVVQPAFLSAFGDDYARIMGPGRADWLYRGRSFLDHGIPLAGSSDRPVIAGAPMEGIDFLVNRRSASGRSIGPEEPVTVEEALHAYTVGAAYACHVEDRLGTVTPGKLADLVVLGADPYQVAAAELADVPVVATLLGGRPTYDVLAPEPSFPTPA